MDVSRTFAVWRIDPPWKPITKKGIGVRMGGGKGSINHYTTPIRADRMIVELGGLFYNTIKHFILRSYVLTPLITDSVKMCSYCFVFEN